MIGDEPYTLGLFDTAGALKWQLFIEIIVGLCQFVLIAIAN